MNSAYDEVGDITAYVPPICLIRLALLFQYVSITSVYNSNVNVKNSSAFYILPDAEAVKQNDFHLLLSTFRLTSKSVILQYIYCRI
jgi:hypothetical protein